MMTATMAVTPQDGSGRVYNFSAGPSCLPLPVLERVQRELLNHGASGMSVMEMSHRGKAFRRIFDFTKATLKELNNCPSTHELLFMHGGGSGIFSALPFNFGLGHLLAGGEVDDGPKELVSAGYVLTGGWSGKAFEEAAKFGADAACVIASGKNADGKYDHVPPVAEWNLPSKTPPRFIHYCSNETVFGVEFASVPDMRENAKFREEMTGEMEVSQIGGKKRTPLLTVDCSSNFCSKPIDVKSHAVMFAGVQKNVGPAALAVAFIDTTVPFTPHPLTPSIFDFNTLLKNDSLYNTPPCFSIYVAGLVAEWIKKEGGLTAMEEQREVKANLVYDVIDGSEGFYTNPVQKNSRSKVNIPFLIKNDDATLTKKFLAEAEAHGLVTLAGHRSVGGCRASLYNAMPLEGAQKLDDFMRSFQQENQE